MLLSVNGDQYDYEFVQLMIYNVPQDQLPQFVISAAVEVEIEI